jgi:hypothetical protein
MAEGLPDRLVKSGLEAGSGSARPPDGSASAVPGAAFGVNTDGARSAGRGAAQADPEPLAPAGLPGRPDPEGLLATTVGPASAGRGGPAGTDGAAGSSGHTDPDGLRAPRVPSGSGDCADPALLQTSVAPAPGQAGLAALP